MYHHIVTKISLTVLTFMSFLTEVSQAATPNVQADGYWRCYDGKITSVTIFGNGPNSASYVFVIDGGLQTSPASFQISSVMPEVFASMANIITDSYIHHKVVSVLFGDPTLVAQPIVQVSISVNALTNCDYGAPGAVNLDLRRQ